MRPLVLFQCGRVASPVEQIAYVGLKPNLTVVARVWCIASSTI